MFLWEWGRGSLLLYIFTNCYASSFPGFLSLLPSNTVSQYAVNNTRKQKNNMCPTIMFVFDFLNAAAEIFWRNYESIIYVCFLSIWGL